ncbi:MAG: prepilin peptidase [Clostridiales bacterium]|jgi:prepilin peptidase CpaA|nr:prepilin peptidase [Clostridiales bacterium]
MEKITDILKICALLFAVIYAAWSDHRAAKIGNRPLIFTALAGFALNALAGFTPGARGFSAEAASAALCDAALGFALPFALLVALFCLRALGAGDIKLLMTVGSLMGAGFVLRTLLYSFVFGGLLALAVAIAHRRLISGLAELGRHMYACLLHRTLLPYGPRAETGSAADHTAGSATRSADPATDHTTGPAADPAADANSNRAGPPRAVRFFTAAGGRAVKFSFAVLLGALAALLLPL